MPMGEAGGDQCHKYFVLEEDYRRFYYLTNDNHGEVVLRLICGPNVDIQRMNFEAAEQFL